MFVIAAGNAHNERDSNGQLVDASSPELLAGLPYYFTDLKSNVIAVVATDKTGSIAYYSNRCGVAKDFCLAAPGGGGADESDVIWTTIPDPEGADPSRDYYGGSIGTSFAAPLVSGSLAILKQMFPSVGNHELVDRLLKTANKSGIYANKDIYGQGMLDLAAATKPVGTTSIATSNALFGDSAPVAETQFNVLNGAMGDALSAGLQNRSVVTFDSMGFPFSLPATSLVADYSHNPAGSGFSHWQTEDRNGFQLMSGIRPRQQWLDPRFHPELADQTNNRYLASHYVDPDTGTEKFTGVGANPGWFFGLYGQQSQLLDSTTDNSYSAPWLSFAQRGYSAGGGHILAGGKFRMALFKGEADWQGLKPDHNIQSSGVLTEFSHQLGSNFLGIQLGQIAESDSFLGMTPGGAIGSSKANQTWFSGINTALSLAGNWRFSLAAYTGITSAQVGNGLLTISDKLVSSSFAAGLSRQGILESGDRLYFGISQPLRVESGSAQLRLPVARTTDQQVAYDQFKLNLEPSAREIRMEVAYDFSLANIRTSARVHYTSNPNHSRYLNNDLAAQLNFAIPLH